MIAAGVIVGVVVSHTAEDMPGCVAAASASWPERASRVHAVRSDLDMERPL
jgi:hypothetical protein